MFDPIGFNESGVVFVDKPSEFGWPVGGVVTLEDNKTYIVTNTVDLAGVRLVCGQNTAIAGTAANHSILKSTGLVGTALLTSVYGLILRDLTITADVGVDLNGINQQQNLEWSEIYFINCGSVGTAKNYGLFIVNVGFFNGSGALTIDGTFNTIGMDQALFVPPSGKTGVVVAATANITRRMRWSYSGFVVNSGAIGIDVSTSATIPVEGYILDTTNFTGLGTYQQGVASSDNKAQFVNCRGITNSGTFAAYYMQGNATATTVAVQGTFYKAAGTTTAGSLLEKFTHTDNRATYSGATGGSFLFTATATMTSGNNRTIALRFAKNGATLAESQSRVTTSGTGAAENSTTQAVIQLSPGDYVEVYVANQSAAQDITVTDLIVNGVRVDS